MFLSKKFNILLPITIFFILGISLNNLLIKNYGENIFKATNAILISFIIFIIIFIILLSIIAIILRNIKFATKISFILSISFFIGMASHQYQITQHRNFLAKIEDKTFNFVATIKDVRDMAHGRNPYYLELLWENENQKITLYTNTPHDLEIGDKIEVKNATFKKIRNNDFLKYLTKEGVATTLFINNFKYKLISRPKFCVAKWINNKKNNILNSMELKMSPVLFATFSSIFLGNKNVSKKIGEETRNKFKEWGILHILARSGLHLVIFLLICELMLKFIPIYFFIKQIIILILSFIYMLLSWSSVSFIRAFYALILYKICPFLHKKADAVHIVTIICLFIIILNPSQIFFLDFQLSFLLTFALAFISKTSMSKKDIKPHTNK